MDSSEKQPAYEGIVKLRDAGYPELQEPLEEVGVDFRFDDCLQLGQVTLRFSTFLVEKKSELSLGFLFQVLSSIFADAIREQTKPDSAPADTVTVRMPRCACAYLANWLRSQKDPPQESRGCYTRAATLLTDAANSVPERPWFCGAWGCLAQPARYVYYVPKDRPLTLSSFVRADVKQVYPGRISDSWESDPYEGYIGQCRFCLCEKCSDESARLLREKAFEKLWDV